MGLNKKVTVRGEATTTDSSTWTTVAQYTVSSNCSISITDIILNGFRSSTTAGSIRAEHRARRVSGVLSLIGSIVYLVTHNTGSDTNMQASTSRINVSGDTLQLQVRGPASATVSWYGEFTVILN